MSLRVSLKPGASGRGSVPRGVFGALQCSELKCPESVPGVSGSLWGQSQDTFLDTPERGTEGHGDTAWDTPSNTPGFQGHSQQHFRDTSGPKGPKDSCSKRGGLQQGNLLGLFFALRRLAGYFCACVIAQAFFSHDASAISLRSRVSSAEFSVIQGNLA